MRNTRLALTLAAGVLAACNPSKTRTPVTTTGSDGASTTPAGTTVAKQGEAMVRLVNALPTSPSVAVNSGDSVVFTNVKYKDVTEYRQVGDKTADFKLMASATPGTQPAAENHELLSNGGRYTAIALPEKDGSGAELKIVRDELVPDAGKAQVRVIHASPGVGEMDVTIDGQKDALFSGVNYSSEAGFKSIDPVAGTLEIRAADTHKRLVSLKGVKFEAGKSYTIVIAGSPMSKVVAITFNDALTPGEPSNN